MNPKTVLWQSLVSAGMIALVALVAEPIAAACLLGIVALAALGLNVAYASALGSHGRPQRRIAGDRLVVSCAGVALLAPLIVLVAALARGWSPSFAPWGFRHAELAALAVATAFLFVVILLSSLVDWYYIRPRIDGVVCTPPCRATEAEKSDWKRVTRRWYLHRGLATLTYIGFALFVAVVVMIMLVREHPAIAAVVGGVSGIAGLLLIFAGSYRSELPTVAKLVLSPAFALGDDVSYNGSGARQRGYVLHVSVPVVKLIPLDSHGRSTDVPFIERKSSALADAELVAKPTNTCAEGCAGLNPECVEAEDRVDRKRRILIIR
jgi:hypothetical protein